MTALEKVMRMQWPKPMTMPLTQEDVSRLTNWLDCSMSPENLACDGEISRSQIRQKAKLFQTAFNQLSTYARKNGFSLPQTWEL